MLSTRLMDGRKAFPTMKLRRLNWIFSDLLRKWLKRYFEWSARLKGQRFYCRALGGESEYNMTINCDLTVSCNCQDYDGSGHIGDLERVPKSQSRAVTGVPGGVARAASGTETDPDGQIFAGPMPRLPHRGMLLENTVRCNIDCIGCDRQSAARIRTTTQMDLDKLSRMADLVHDLGLEQLFYLNLGEPFLSPNIGEELPLLRKKNPDCRIVISTNGMVLNSAAKREAALSASHIFFSIAGISDAMLKKYEHFGSYEKAYANMKALVEHRNAQGLTQPLLEWKYLLFNWNDHPQTIAQAIELAKAAGVDAISFWPTHNPFYGYSYRYAFGWLNHVGVKSWKGREVDLRPAARQQSLTASKA